VSLQTSAIERQRAGSSPPGALPAADPLESPIGREYARVFAFLASIRSVYAGLSCLTEEGSNYLGIEHRFPTLAEHARAAEAAPADVRPLRLVKT
jgi:hypothetical protein